VAADLVQAAAVSTLAGAGALCPLCGLKGADAAMWCPLGRKGCSLLGKVIWCACCGGMMSYMLLCMGLCVCCRPGE
jgi:hypothetical protein